MKETLTCGECSKTWKREVSRGRKPTLCPKCLKKSLKKDSPVAKVKNQPVPVKEEKRAVVATPLQLVATSNSDAVDTKDKISITDVYRDYYPLAANYQELLESTKNGSKWGCSKCGAKITINVPVTAVPTHRCPQKSTNVKPYERID